MFTGLSIPLKRARTTKRTGSSWPWPSARSRFGLIDSVLRVSCSGFRVEKRLTARCSLLTGRRNRARGERPEGRAWQRIAHSWQGRGRSYGLRVASFGLRRHTDQGSAWKLCGQNCRFSRESGLELSVFLQLYKYWFIYTMSYKYLDIYLMSYSLALKIHELSMKLPRHEMYEEGSQVRRSSKGITACIVEGYGRRRYKADFVRFWVYAHASCDETLLHLQFLKDTWKLNSGQIDSLIDSYNELGRKINQFIQYVEKDWNSKLKRSWQDHLLYFFFF